MNEFNTQREKKQAPEIEKLSTKDMSREEWLAQRNLGIGGSDASSVLGLNPWKSAYALWAEKSGKLVPEDISDRETIRLGTDLEQYVAQRFMEETGKRVRRDNFILRNSAYPFAHANIDRWVIGENAGLECKTSSSWDMAKQCRAGEIPQAYYCQCVHYMAITGAERWYLGILCFGTGFFLFTVERDEAEIQALMDAERDFWKLVTDDTPPALDGAESTTEAVKVIFAESNPGERIDLTAVGASVEAYNALTAQIKELEELRDSHANTIKEFMAEAEKGTYGGTTISWKSSTRKTFDKDRYEKTVGTIPDEFYKTSATRTFRVTVSKKEAM